MESTDDNVKVPEKKEGFVDYVFGFHKPAKDELVNMIQYALYAIIPILLLLRLIEYVIPDYDPTKSYLENLAESLGQYGLILIGTWFIDRIVRYIPTWTKEPYHSFNYTFLIPFILAISTRQTKIGLKLNAFMDKILGTVGVKYDDKNPQPPAQPMNPAQLGPPPPISTQQDNHQTYNTAPLLPDNKDLTKMPSQPSPDFNAMYQHDNTPLQDAKEPMAANDALGGFSSW